MKKILWFFVISLAISCLLPAASHAQAFAIGVNRGPVTVGGGTNSGGEIGAPVGVGNTCGGGTTTTKTTTPSCTPGNITIGFYYSAYSGLPGTLDANNFNPFGNGDQIDTHCYQVFCGVQVTAGGVCSNWVYNSTTDQQTCQGGGSSFDNPYSSYMSSLLSMMQSCASGKTTGSDCAQAGVAATNSSDCTSVQTCMGYCPNATVTFIGSEMQCPIKVNLAGKDAKLNTNNGLRFTLKDRKGKSYELETSGGLNSDEAWLIADRDGSGNFVQNGVINGEDWFTDHVGQHRNGYEDLLNNFAPFIKQDEKGAYIALHHVDDKAKAKEKEAAAKRALSHNGYERAIDPSLDLKLLDAHGNILFASDYFTRIYVTYQEANEKSKKNVILERAPVVDINGETHTSADQWFVPKSVEPME